MTRESGEEAVCVPFENLSVESDDEEYYLQVSNTFASRTDAAATAAAGQKKFQRPFNLYFSSIFKCCLTSYSSKAPACSQNAIKPARQQSFSSDLPYFGKRPEGHPISKLLPTKHSRFRNSLTVVLDLDETLSHSILDQNYSGASDFVFEAAWQQRSTKVHVLLRPGVRQFLRILKRLKVEIVVFTASIELFASPVLNFIDPNEEYFTHRLYRDSCTFYNGIFIKDLHSLNRDVSSCYIVDNSPFSYSWHPEHAIPIATFAGPAFGSSSKRETIDSELLRIARLLEQMVRSHSGNKEI